MVMLLLGSITFSFAQEIKGIVYDLETSRKLPDVQIKNLRTNDMVKSDLQGNFTIPGKMNDYLSLMVQGYDRDTAFIYQEGITRIYLVNDKSTITIDEVVVSKITDSRLTREIERAKNNSKAVETSTTRGGLRISPSRLFGKEAKQARASIEILEIEREQRNVDRVFTNDAILSLIPMERQDLLLFKDGYRPSYEFIKQASPEDLKAYILDSYAKFKKNKVEPIKQ
ncbi:Uncharacterised protein [Sphingobacterium mizutaii]|uniref:CarboxypepD_reg-like domain-containing protein n=3 Tax=Sphingobacteriaceae TaxID=84566 RepID=A0AAJ4XCV7_9SPHI|nr:hypothetical protein SAMN05192578_101758 [Sphingobacterium mizutaii]SNV49795.1 Uncharacterised protein [Sphingobacterium mizutaii]